MINAHGGIRKEVNIMSKNKKNIKNEEIRLEELNNEEIVNNEDNIINDENNEIVENKLEELNNEENVNNEIVENIEGAIEEKIIRGIVTCDKLNVRKEANKSADIITVIPKDLVLTILDTDTSEDFYKVLIGDVEGYCMKQFITIAVE